MLDLESIADVVLDHPREYGENPSAFVSVNSTMGSSPRIRGECRWSRLPGSGVPDHPREYGENCWGWGLRGGFRGSSPRIRGES